MATPGRLMTRRQVAEHLAIGERAVDKLREDGTPQAVKVGSRVRVTWESVDAYRRPLPPA